MSVSLAGVATGNGSEEHLSLTRTSEASTVATSESLGPMTAAMARSGQQQNSDYTSETQVCSGLGGGRRCAGWGELLLDFFKLQKGAALSLSLPHCELPTFFLPHRVLDYTGPIQRIQDNLKILTPACNILFASRFQDKAL